MLKSLSARAILVVALVLPVTLVSSGCMASATVGTPAPPGISDHALQVTAKAILDVDQSNAALQSAIINANAAKLISDANAQKLLVGVCQRINLANAEASKITRGLSKLTPAQRGSLTAIFTPVLAAVNDALANGLLGITDANTKTQVQGALTTIQVGLSGVQVALGGA
jgi:hypothetical protein